MQSVVTWNRGDEQGGDVGMAESARGDGASGHEKLEAMWEAGETVEYDSEDHEQKEPPLPYMGLCHTCRQYNMCLLD